jgi:hypothetical protein
MFDLDSSLLVRRSFLGASVGAMAAGFAAQALPALAQTPTDVTSNFFPGFRRNTIQTSGTTINVVVGGNGPPILLLHGYPQTHVEWRKIAPHLAANYTVVIPISGATATAASQKMETITSIIQSAPWLWIKSK